MPDTVAVLGAGSWGMAIAHLLNRNGCQVTLWEYNRDEYQKLVKDRALPSKLQGFSLDQRIQITNDLAIAVMGVQLLIGAIPSQFCRSVLKQIDSLRPGVGYLNLAKGIELNTLVRMSELVQEELNIEPSLVATLSGPSHAEEVVADMPTAVVVASESKNYARRLQEMFSSDCFRVYVSDDLIGVELGGSLKNIIAIASGIIDGLDLGDNTRGALLTRGLAEIVRLGVTVGAKPETFSGLSGIGDLITTCSSRHSRNRYVGECLGKGEKLPEIVSRMSMVAEGVETTRSGKALADRYAVEMPITQMMYRVLFEEKDPGEAVSELMGRKLKTEVWK